MRIHIGAIGKLKKGPELQLANGYIDRIRKTGRSAGILDLKIFEYPESAATGSTSRKSEESSRLLNACPPSSTILVLDEYGKDLSSMEFTDLIAKTRDNGVADMVFLIGGPDGHDQKLLDNASHKISLGKKTWPHRLVRIMLTEQIYRSITIMLNHPYHRS